MHTDPRKTPEAERELVLRARAGDAQAFAELFTRFWRAARATAYAVLKNMSSAEDAAAEAFRIALPGLRRLRDPERFGPWLRRIVRRVASRELLVIHRRTESSDDELSAALPDPSLALERREMALLVEDAIERLTAAEREAIALYYFEGYDTEDAARFLNIPVGSFRRRLHDGRKRLRKHLGEALDAQGSRQSSSAQLQLQLRVRALLSTDAPQSEWYSVMRDILLSRPVPYQLLAPLFRDLAFSDADVDFLERLLTRPQGPLLDDPGRVGEAARALRTALIDFEDWVVDHRTELEAFVNRARRGVFGPHSGRSAASVPPGVSSDRPGRYVRISRGLLFGEEAAAVVDPAEMLLRSSSLEAFRHGTSRPSLSDVFDVYWSEPRPIELSEVEAWVMDLASRVAPTAQSGCSVHAGLRYRMALRLSFTGDSRPAAIGGVLSRQPGAPEEMQFVHVRLYVQPWAQARSGRPVAMERLGG